MLTQSKNPFQQIAHEFLIYRLNSYFCKVVNILENDPKGMIATATVKQTLTDLTYNVFVANLTF